MQVITPSAGGPAERAGVAPRDVLLAIGDQATADMSLYEAGDLLQGPPGSQVSARAPTCSMAGICLMMRHSMICQTLLSGDYIGSKTTLYG
jgi:hypothetical protein